LRSIKTIFAIIAGYFKLIVLHSYQNRMIISQLI